MFIRLATEGVCYRLPFYNFVMYFEMNRHNILPNILNKDEVV